MILKNKDGIYQIKGLLLPGLIHGFSTKQFGNMALKYGSAKEVEINRQNFLKKLEIEDKVAHAGLIHGTKVEIVNKSGLYENVDGLITNSVSLPLRILTGDCAPFLFFDPSKKVIGVAHSGWRGTVAKLPTIMFAKMVINFGCKPENILIGIGPSIEKCHYVKGRPIFPEDFPDWNNFLAPEPESKIRIDLNGFSIEQLIEIGAKKENIFYSSFCTYDHHDEFFCSQREKTGEDKPGRFATVIQMK